MSRLALAVIGLAACGGGAGAPHRRPAPTPDGVPALLEPGARSPRIASYTIDATLDADAHRVTGTERLVWRNTGSIEVKELKLHLYMNAFKNEQSVFMQESHGSHRGIEFDGHWGWIDVSDIKVAGVAVEGSTGAGPDETVLTVPATVAPGAEVVVDLAFTTQLPSVFARTGFSGGFHMVAQWFPKIGVLGNDDAWHCEPFHLASEFFADFGTYDVTLHVPDTEVVAATGVLVASADGPDGTHVLTYRAEDVHDFVWMADPHMAVLRGEAHVGDHTVEVRVYHRPEQAAFAKRHLAAGIGSIEEFSKLFVPYPWPVMSIVDPPVGVDGAAGMEYPTLVATGGDSWYAPDGVRLPEYTTIHEVGHNWFQGIVASNEVDEAWMDEGINNWADGEVIARLYGEKAGIVDWMGVTMEVHRAMRAISGKLGSLPAPITTASYAFLDDDAYATTTYIKTELALATLENLVGRDAFLAAMKAYTEAWAWKHPTGRDFFGAVGMALQQDLAWFWDPVFHGTGGVDYRVRSTSCLPNREPRGVFGDGDDRHTVSDGKATGAFHCEVVVENTGTVWIPVEVELRFADGTTDTRTWTAAQGPRFARFPIDRSSEITEVRIDPRRQVLLADGVLDDDLRLVPDERAAARAAARIGFWTHTAMQVTGL